MNYRVLALDSRSKQMSLPVLRKINELVEAGAIVAGPEPESDPSLADDQAEFHSLAQKLWGSGSGESVGKGRVYGVQKLEDVLQTLNISPDFEYTRPKTDTSILFVHRKLADGDIAAMSDQRLGTHVDGIDRARARERARNAVPPGAVGHAHRDPGTPGLDGG